MQMHILASQEIIDSMPESVTQMADWGHVSIDTGSGEDQGFVGRDLHGGTHIAVDGKIEDIHAWLKPFSPIWVGRGAPMMQQFYETHIRAKIS